MQPEQMLSVFIHRWICCALFWQVHKTKWTCFAL